MSLQPDPADGFVPVRELADATGQVLADFVDTTVRNPELWLYRERTVALLRRYLRISIRSRTAAFVAGPGIVSLQSYFLPNVEFRRRCDLCV